MSTDNKKLKNYITLASAFIALMSALSSLMLTRTLNKSVLTKNEEAIVQSKIADQWAYYQSKNIRIEILKSHSNGILHAAHTSEAEDQLNQKRSEISQEARELEAVKGQLAVRSQLLNSVAQYFSSAVALLQLALMLMPITYIRESKSFLAMGVLMSLFGAAYFFTGALELSTVI